MTYDRNSDVLYVSRRPGVPARSREEMPGVVWRYDAERGDLIVHIVRNQCCDDQSLSQWVELWVSGVGSA